MAKAGQRPFQPFAAGSGRSAFAKRCFAFHRRTASSGKPAAPVPALRRRLRRSAFAKQCFAFHRRTASSGKPAAPVPALRRRLRALGVCEAVLRISPQDCVQRQAKQRPVPALRRRLLALGVCEAVLRISPQDCVQRQASSALVPALRRRLQRQGARRLRSGASHFTAGLRPAASQQRPFRPFAAGSGRSAFAKRCFAFHRRTASSGKPAAPVPALRRRLRALGVCEAVLRISPQDCVQR